jgi:hypothetical protein
MSIPMDSESFEWVSWGQHLKVWSSDKTLLFSSVTGFISPLLSDRQAAHILAFYESKRNVYTFETEDA